MAHLLGITSNSVARMERAEQPIRPSLERLVLLIAHLAERGDNYAVQLADREKRKRS
jgi:hypothetical protein